MSATGPRVVRGRAETVETDREATRTLVDRTAADRTVRVRVWTPHPHVAFGRRDANREGYERAREHASDRGYPVVERSVGGHAVAFTGRTVAVSCAVPVDEARSGIQDRYDRFSSILLDALADLGVDATEGEPDGAFCPGTHSLSATGKVVGLAQRVHSDAAAVSAVVVVKDHDAIAAVLDPVYDALSIPFRRDAVGSIARAGGDAAPDRVRSLLERHLAGTDDPTPVPVDDLI